MYLAWKNLFRHIDQTTQDDGSDGREHLAGWRPVATARRGRRPRATS